MPAAAYGLAWRRAARRAGSRCCRGSPRAEDVDGAVTVYAGVACGTDGHGAATLTISAASREGDGSAPASTFVLASASFRWDGRWVRTSQSTRTGVAERTAAAPAGFHCAGLPRF